jgi:hypothetical protein
MRLLNGMRPLRAAAQRDAALTGCIQCSESEPVGESLSGTGGVASPLWSVVVFDLFASGDSEGHQAMTNDSKGLVGLLQHRQEARERCFGIIGASNQACTRFSDDCGIGSHKSKKVDIALGSVHICCPSKENCLYITPAVNVLGGDGVPDCVVGFLHVKLQMVDAQVQLLSSLPSEDELLDEDVQERFQDMQQQFSLSVQFGRGNPGKTETQRDPVLG